MTICGDSLEILKTMADNSVDSVVTDPPYGLSFMGKKWDYDVPSEEIWQECLRVLKPGGYLLAFAGTRTQHRMAVRIEDAGFEIRDMIAWVYGSGFPKSLNIGKAVDKLQGNERELLPPKTFPDGSKDRKTANHKFYADEEEQQNTYTNTKGTSEWEGWGTALKPALEPITVARKPLSEKTVAENVLKWGTGGINIDGSRVDFVSEEDRKESTTKNQHADFGTKPMTNNNVYGDYSMIEPKNFNPTGRFPANLIHDGSEEVLELFPNESSRFFYCAKASKKDRNEGLEGFREKTAGERTNRKEGSAGDARNNHPTVKPTALMQYLVKLVTPPNGTVLDPFMGSGSTGKACKKEGFNFIGIDREEEYVKIAEARINAIRV